jgi:CBS domain-containing protein
MTLDDAVTREPVKLRPTDTVARAVELLVEGRAVALPVVDEAGELVGMFGIDDLAKMLLPRAVTLGVGLEELADLDFVADTLGEVRERMGEVCEEPVGRHLEGGRSQTLDPDSSFTEALFLLHRLRRDLPVVEEETGKLVGMVSPWDVLARLG